MRLFIAKLYDNKFHLKERVWAELDEVFGESDRYCTQQDLINLTYLDCCIKESLRLYSVAPHIERYLKEDFQLGLAKLITTFGGVHYFFSAVDTWLCFQ